MKIDNLISILKAGRFEDENVRISIIDSDSCFRFISTTVIGFSEDYLGKNVLDYYAQHLDEDQLEKVRTSINDTLAGKTSEGVIKLSNKFNLKEVNWDYKMFPFFDEDGKTYAVSEISPREIHLGSTSTNFFIKAMVEQSSDTFTVFDQNLDFAYISKSNSTWGDTSLIGKHISYVLSGVNLEHFKSRVKAAKEKPGDIITDVIKIKIPNHGECYLESSMEFHDFGELGHFFLDRTSDVTERYNRTKEIEAHKNAIDKMSKWTALGQMAANIAHEVNNPLAIIELQIQSIERRSGSKIPKDLMGKITSIADQKNRIANIVSSLNIYSHENKSVRETIALSSIVHDSIALFKTRFVDDELKIVFSNEADSDLVEVNSSEIVQVIINLLNNAYDAIAVLDDKWIELTLYDNSHNVYLDVLDSGNGIDKHVADSIFERFYTTKSKEKGCGLGLNISQEIIHDHKGSLCYDSNSENTNFTITIPKVPLS